MKYETAGAFRDALEQRLRIQSRETGSSLSRLRKLVTFDRLLARIVHIAPERWVLKGGLALDYRLGTQFRTTKDVDLTYSNHEVDVTRSITQTQSVDLHDYFTFSIERVAGLGNEDQEDSIRFNASAEVAGRIFERIPIDVEQGAAFIQPLDTMTGPALLAFAEISPSSVQVIPIEVHLAEKMHAYTRVYSHNRPSSRTKDLIDLVLIQAHMQVRAGDLRQALRSTFSKRGTHTLPTRLPPPPDDWIRPYQRLASEAGIDADIMTGYRSTEAFLNPVLSSLTPDNATWDPGLRDWKL